MIISGITLFCIIIYQRDRATPKLPSKHKALIIVISRLYFTSKSQHSLPIASHDMLCPRNLWNISYRRHTHRNYKLNITPNKYCIIHFHKLKQGTWYNLAKQKYNLESPLKEQQKLPREETLKTKKGQPLPLQKLYFKGH